MMNRFGKSVVAKLLPNENKKAAQAAAQAIAELELVEKRDLLKLTKTFRYGFPFEPTSIAYDVLQHLLAIGNKHGYVKLYGDELVETTIVHPSSASVLFMTFVINEGALITYCEDMTISFWNLRQKQPAISHSRKLNERASCLFLPNRNKWIYLGTEKGNIYVLNIYSSFSQSGYDLKWNNVIELSQKTHPGKVVHLSDNPVDNTKMLIGFDTGLIVLWNVKNKKAEARFYGPSDSVLISISWLYDGKQFVSSHSNGFILTWSCKNEGKAISSTCPHYDETDLVRSYNPINKISWATKQSGEQLTIFSNGLAQHNQIKDGITILRNKIKTVVEMKSKIIDFLIIDTSFWQSDEPPDTSALIVLLEDDIVTIDLKTEGFPLFKHHHSIELHESPISFTDYLVDPDLKLIQHLFISKEKQTKAAPTSNNLPKYSTLGYPICGGLKSSKPTLFPYYELVVTGHEDGSIKIWEASGICLDNLYKIKTQKIFEKRRIEASNIDFEHPYKITNVAIYSNYMAVAAVGGHVTLYKYTVKKNNNADDGLSDVTQLDIPIHYDYPNEKTYNDAAPPVSDKKDLKTLLRVKIGCKRHEGYQPELVCLLLWQYKPPIINNLVINTKYGLLLIGTEESIICVDYISRTIVLNISIIDYYGSQDPFQRNLKSPRKSKISESFFATSEETNDTNNPINFLAKQFTIDNSNFNLQRTMDATMKDNSSTSSSSLNNLCGEGVSFIAINEPLLNILNNSKNDQPNHAVVWVGTSYGTVILLSINSTISEFNKDSNAQTSIIDDFNSTITTLVPNGVKHFLKGQILYITFLDNFGTLLTPRLEYSKTVAAPNIHASSSAGSGHSSSFSFSMDNSSLDDHNKGSVKPHKKPLMMSRSSRVESVSDYTDRIQYAVLCSEKQIKVISLPSQSTAFKYDLDDETATIAKADVAVLNNYSYLICLLNNGNILTFNLPSLKQNNSLLLSLNQQEKEEMDHIIKTFTFGPKGHSYYMPTQNEIQKLIITSINENHNLTELLPELFDPKITTPTAPKPGIFKTIFSATPFDRDQLFGDTTVKPSQMLVRPLEADVNKANKELSDLQKLALQRGEKLGNLEKQTQEMVMQASAYAENASKLANKYKKKSQWPFS